MLHRWCLNLSDYSRNEDYINLAILIKWNIQFLKCWKHSISGGCVQDRLFSSFDFERSKLPKIASSKKITNARFLSSFLLKLPICQDEKALGKYAVVRANLLYALNKKGSLYLASMETMTYWICVVNLWLQRFSQTAQRFVLGAFNRTSAIEMLSFHPGVVGPFSHNALKSLAQSLNPTFWSQNTAARLLWRAVRDGNEARANCGPCLLPEMTNETIKHLTRADQSDERRATLRIIYHSTKRQVIHHNFWQPGCFY